MFKRSFGQTDRVNKIRKPSKRSFRDDAKQKLREQLNLAQGPPSAGKSPRLNTAIVMVAVGKDQRLFASHEDVLYQSPIFKEMLQNTFFEADGSKRLVLVDEEPEIFSGVLEYLYKGDYSPRLVLDKKRDTWVIETDDMMISTPKSDNASMKTFSTRSSVRTPLSPTLWDSRFGDFVLRDTAIYCAAERYGLEALKRLALRKQGKQACLDVATILRSARYAYEYTPETETALRAHYLAVIIRGRKTFKRSGTMEREMAAGGSRLFYDLFVALCNHCDDMKEGLGSRNCSAKSSPTLVNY